MLRRFALSALLALPLFITSSANALERSLDGGAHIWAGGGWGEFRAYAGPRFTWDWFSLYPYGAIGPAFFSGVQGSPLSVGAYGDATVSVPVGELRWLQFGAGGGAGHVVGIEKMTGPVYPQAYGQINFRWAVNTVGIMALWGQEYKRPGSFPATFPAKLNFSGIGFRFEYEIDNYGGGD